MSRLKGTFVLMQITFAQPTVGDMVANHEVTSSITGERFPLRNFNGRHAVLLFCPNEQMPEAVETLKAFSAAHEKFAERGILVVMISLSPPEKLKTMAEEMKLPFMVVSDPLLRASAGAGALRPKDAAPGSTTRLELNAMRRTLLLTPDSRIQRIYDNPSPETHPQEVLNDFAAATTMEPPRKIGTHAPVLLIPNVLSPELCQRLIALWHEENEDSGFMRQVEGKTVGMYDYNHKIRRDHFLKPGEVLESVKRPISTRVIPAMRMAFNYEVTRFEDIRVACYDAARGGYFRPHRDNTTEATAHRRFAMSLLLNDDYEGGALRFPEYGLHEYRPGIGGAVVFSCSLLHEAMDVTAGRRFVMLTFFYGDREAKLREEYSLRTGGQYRAGQGATAPAAQ
jgi:peroxiredoxin/predicted 2-oxoglutarate/Fe(II)-dependent dioxygenase YbiX